MSTPDAVPAPLLLLIAAVGAVVVFLVMRRARWRDPQRLFSIGQKRFLADRAGGRCEHKPMFWFRCPEDGTQADHIRPWSKGGPTTVENGQLLCRSCNRRKSDWMPTIAYRWRLEYRRRRY